MAKTNHFNPAPRKGYLSPELEDLAFENQAMVCQSAYNSFGTSVEGITDGDDANHNYNW